MSLNRRQFLQYAGALGALGALGSQAALAQVLNPQRMQPWRNWSGVQTCLPAQQITPKSLGELVSVIAQSTGTIRPVGAGHSFSPLVPTDDTLLSLGYFGGMLSHDSETHQAEFGAGTSMALMGMALNDVGQGFINMADIDHQTLGGAVATSTHGTGIKYGSYSSYIKGLQLVTASGEVLDCDATRNPEVFHAARVSMGSLGVITKLTMQNRPGYRLRETMWVAKTEDLLADIDKHVSENQHWEMLVITHSDYALAIALNETEEPATPPVNKAESGGNEFVTLLEKLDKYGSDFPSARRFLLNNLRHFATFDERIGESYEIYSNVRSVRFNEMEYSVPAEHGPACLREILQLIERNDLPTWFPLEYRYVQADDVPLSMFQGRDSCAISVHQHYSMDYHNLFAAIEPIFWKYDGRPHWGKLHTLNARHLEKLYPQWREFTGLRESLDPQGRFLNAHLRSILGA
ncbi:MULTISPECIES: D-arabinono-1,4-lactone oxidase [Marinobacter]|uniref:D-arabinono-1,4-lactone oxidase n=1 Tax=Marinobacter xiaoshiensis TaxID=3073652 RepID=A0ABU2HIH8_9GAMM|nr:D-arabinono-1,4-lactone oxidase [Marinobacter sp. F60267]MDS1310827.1 D-arabinono-1,4-lactone oxidase [Marinobacter sp. F60267]